MFRELKKAKLSLLSLAMSGLLTSAAAYAQSAPVSGYVPMTFGINPGHPSQNITVGSVVDACIRANPGLAGSVMIYVNTSDSGTGTYLGTETGNGVIFNSLQEGNQSNAATYYFYGYYLTSGIVNGSPDPCDNVSAPSAAKQWAALSIVPLS